MSSSFLAEGSPSPDGRLDDMEALSQDNIDLRTELATRTAEVETAARKASDLEAELKRSRDELMSMMSRAIKAEARSEQIERDLAAERGSKNALEADLEIRLAAERSSKSAREADLEIRLAALQSDLDAERKAEARLQSKGEQSVELSGYTKMERPGSNQGSSTNLQGQRATTEPPTSARASGVAGRCLWPSRLGFMIAGAALAVFFDARRWKREVLAVQRENADLSTTLAERREEITALRNGNLDLNALVERRRAETVLQRAAVAEAEVRSCELGVGQRAFVLSAFRDAFARCSTFREASAQVKKSIEQRFGGAWSVAMTTGHMGDCGIQASNTQLHARLDNVWFGIWSTSEEVLLQRAAEAEAVVDHSTLGGDEEDFVLTAAREAFGEGQTLSDAGRMVKSGVEERFGGEWSVVLLTRGGHQVAADTTYLFARFGVVRLLVLTSPPAVGPVDAYG